MLFHYFHESFMYFYFYLFITLGVSTWGVCVGDPTSIRDETFQ